jgi:predicted RNase H-like HicB family nuclease
MFHYIYPAVFFYNDEEFQVLIPDLNLTCSGISLEEAYILAKDFLRAYFEYAQKFDMDTLEPSNFNEILEKYRNDKTATVMLIDAMVKKQVVS